MPSPGSTGTIYKYDKKNCAKRRYHRSLEAALAEEKQEYDMESEEMSNASGILSESL